MLFERSVVFRTCKLSSNFFFRVLVGGSSPVQVGFRESKMHTLFLNKPSVTVTVKKWPPLEYCTIVEQSKGFYQLFHADITTTRDVTSVIPVGGVRATLFSLRNHDLCHH